MHSTEHHDLISTAEAAALLGISVWTVLRRVADGRLTVAVKGPGVHGARLYHLADVEALRDEAKAAS